MSLKKDKRDIKDTRDIRDIYGIAHYSQNQKIVVAIQM
jgi:hypothetical protein